MKHFLFHLIFGIIVLFFFLGAKANHVYALCTGSTTCHYYERRCIDIDGTDAGPCNNNLCPAAKPNSCGTLNGGTCTCIEKTGASQSCSSCGIANGCFPFCGTVGTPSGPDVSGCEWLSASCQNTFCGDGICNGGESNASCPGDCPPAASPPPPGGACPGTCKPSAANCGAYGMSDLTGTCPAGQMCCGSKPPEVCNCCGDAVWAKANTVRGDCQDAYGEWTKGANAGLAHQCDRCACTPTVQCPNNCNNPNASVHCCGQANGCGKNCKSDDSGTPKCPVITSPSGGQLTMDNTGLVTISWNKVSAANYPVAYKIKIVPKGKTCSSAYAICPAARITGTSYQFYPNTKGGNQYQVTVTPVNNYCGSAPTCAAATFTIMTEMKVNFYADNNGQASNVGGMCQLAGAGTTSPGAGASISVQGQNANYAGTITGNTATILVPYWPQPGANNIVQLNPGTGAGGKSITCTCPAGCSYSGLASPQEGINFFVNDGSASLDTTHTSWWQAIGGNVEAYRTSGLAILDAIPVATCTTTNGCVPSIIRKDLTNTDNSAGIAITGGGRVVT